MNEHIFSLVEQGRAFIPIHIKQNDGHILLDVDFKVDTGADVTTISKMDLLQLGYDAAWIERHVVIHPDTDKPTSADGEKLNAGYIQLPLINILGYEGKSWPFQILLDERVDFRNLVGRDLLSGFNYTFDNDRDLLLIRRANSFKTRRAMLPGQEINEIKQKAQTVSHYNPLYPVAIYAGRGGGIKEEHE
jgi:hypothetical protein